MNGPVFNRTVAALTDGPDPPVPPRRRRSALRGFVAAAVVVGLGAFASEAFGARSATALEARVVRDAAVHLSAVGVATAVPEVLVMTGDDCGWLPVFGEVPYACALRDAVVLSVEAARDAGTYAAVVARGSRRGRQAALSGCVDRCVLVMGAAVHELVHLARWRRLGEWPQTPAGQAWEEGLAEAVARDQVCPFAFRVSGAAVCTGAFSSYDGEVAAVRSVSGRAVGAAWWSAPARRWRLNMIGGS